MNYLTTSLIALSLSLTATVNAADFVAMNNTKLTNLCVTAAQGNKEKMRIAIWKSGYSKHYITTNIKCNGLMLTEFVAQHGQSPDVMNAMLTGKPVKKASQNNTELAKL